MRYRGDNGVVAQLSEDVRDRLLMAGASIDEIDRAEAHDDLYALVGDLVRRRGLAWRSIDEVAVAARTTRKEVERYRLLAALPAGEEMIPESTVEGLEHYGVAAAFAGEEGAREFGRAVASAAARVAETATGVFLNNIAPALEASDVAPSDAVQLIEAMTSELITRTPKVFELLFREHLLIAARRGRAEHEAELARVAVGFVDLVGSTDWAEQTSPSDHATALSRFEDAAWTAASAAGCRVVKMIGDEAMLVGSDPNAVVLAMNEICCFAELDAVLPAARGAVGLGTAFARAGDYFGPLVNLVARAVKVADCGEIVVTAETALLLRGDRFDFRPLGPRELRGVAMPVELVAVSVRIT